MANRMPPSKRGPKPDGDDSPPSGTFRAKLAEPSAREKIKDAGIVFGVDTRTGHEHLFFGVATLERIVGTGREKNILVLRVPIDFKTDDVETLAAACLTLKGSHCYQTPEGGADPIMVGLN